MVTIIQTKDLDQRWFNFLWQIVIIIVCIVGIVLLVVYYKYFNIQNAIVNLAYIIGLYSQTNEGLLENQFFPSSLSNSIGTEKAACIIIQLLLLTQGGTNFIIKSIIIIISVTCQQLFLSSKHFITEWRSIFYFSLAAILLVIKLYFEDRDSRRSFLGFAKSIRQENQYQQLINELPIPCFMVEQDLNQVERLDIKKVNKKAELLFKIEKDDLYNQSIEVFKKCSVFSNKNQMKYSFEKALNSLFNLFQKLLKKQKLKINPNRITNLPKQAFQINYQESKMHEVQHLKAKIIIMEMDPCNEQFKTCFLCIMPETKITDTVQKKKYSINQSYIEQFSRLTINKLNKIQDSLQQDQQQDQQKDQQQLISQNVAQLQQKQSIKISKAQYLCQNISVINEIENNKIIINDKPLTQFLFNPVLSSVLKILEQRKLKKQLDFHIKIKNELLELQLDQIQYLVNLNIFNIVYFVVKNSVPNQQIIILIDRVFLKGTNCKVLKFSIQSNLTSNIGEFEYKLLKIAGVIASSIGPYTNIEQNSDNKDQEFNQMTINSYIFENLNDIQIKSSPGKQRKQTIDNSSNIKSVRLKSSSNTFNILFTNQFNQNENLLNN